MAVKKRMSKTIFLIVALLFGCAVGAFSKSISLADINNMQQRLLECSDGDTIIITGNSRLADSVNVNKSVTILGGGHTITRSSQNCRISFSADVKVSDLVFDANQTSSTTLSFIFVNELSKLTMDENTIITNSANGPVIIVGGTCVGGVIKGNKLTNQRTIENSCIIRVSANGKIVNSLIYGNEVSSNSSSYYAYLLMLRGGHAINCTIVDNKLSGANNNGRTLYAYAVTSSSTSSTLENCIVCNNKNSRASSQTQANVERDANLQDSQILTSYVGDSNPGFTSMQNNDYTLLASSSCVNSGNNNSNKEPFDLVGLSRISGSSIDMGAYEYQECAIVTASKSTELIYGEKVVLEADNINPSFSNIAISYQWQSSKDGRDWSNIGRDANSSRYVIESVSKDIPYYRLCISRKATSEPLCYVNAPVLQFAAPYVKFFVDGYDRVVTHYAFEAAYGSTFSFGLERVNDARVTDFKITRKLLQRPGEADKTYGAAEVSNYKYQCEVNEAYEFNLSYTYQIGGNSVKKDTSFILRPIYKCTGKNRQTIWHDDFGRFVNGTYYYDYNDDTDSYRSSFSSYRSGNTTYNVAYTYNRRTGYAAPDPNNAVVRHDYFARNSYRTDDGYYSIVFNSGDAWQINGQDQFGHYPDHTFRDLDKGGGMLMVNCREDSKDTEIYQRDFSVECDSSLVIFSSYVSNVNAWDVATWGNHQTLINANVRLDIYEVEKVNGSEKLTLLQSAYSGELLSRLHDYDNDPNVDTYWSNLSAKFLADAGKTYRVVLVNNSNGGAGNDIAFDDILITACCPDMAVSDNPSFVNEKQNVEICGTDSSSFTIYAIMRDGTVADDYFISPYYYLYQYREKGSQTWKSFVQGTDSFFSVNHYAIDLNTFPSGAECRAILARSTQRIEQIVRYYETSDKSLPEEKRYPEVNCREGIYGVAYGFTVNYFPELGEISADKVKVACPNDPVTFSYDPGEVWSERTWLDANNQLLNSGSSLSVVKSNKEIDVYHYVIAGEGGVCPDTITFEAHVNRSLAFNDVEDIYANAGANCKANVSIDGYKPSFNYCAADLKRVDYYYRTNSKNGAWLPLTQTSSVEVADNDTVYWQAKLFVDGSDASVDSVFYNQPAHVTDVTKPSIVYCDDLSAEYKLAKADAISGKISVSVTPSDIQNASEDNCTSVSSLGVLWNAASGSSFMPFGDSYTFDLNAYYNPLVQIAWKVTDEANLESDACVATYEVKKDTTENGENFAVIRDTIICAGSFPLTWYGHEFNKDGDTAHVGYALLKVFADSSYFRTITVTACDQYEFNGKTYERSGIYTDYMTNVNGCDSVFTLNLTINESFASKEIISACDSFLWNGVVYKASGLYEKQFVASNGCDSIATLDLTIGTSYYDTATVAIANSYTWPVNGAIYIRSGQFVDTKQSVSGCDSIHVLKLTVYQPSYGSERIRLCRSELPYVYTPAFAHEGDQTPKLIVSDTIFTFPRAGMGDSIVSFDLTILEASSYTQNVDVCRTDFPYTFSVFNNLVVYNPQSDTIFTIKNRVGCDSTITLNFNILEPSPVTYIDTTVCESFDYMGVTYTADTSFSVFLKNVAGCDSVVDVKVKVNYTLFATEDLGLQCDSVFWHGNWYYEDNNIATFDTVSKVTGCDSITTLKVKISHSVTTRDNLHLCSNSFDGSDSYYAAKWDETILKPASFPATYDFTYYAKTVMGCDSIVNVHVTMHDTIAIHDTVIAQDSYFWPVNGDTYFESLDYGMSSPVDSYLGCDSISTLNLHIVPTKFAQLDTAICDKLTFRYGNVNYTTDKDTSWQFAYKYDTLIPLATRDTIVFADSILTLNVKKNKRDTVYLEPLYFCAPSVWNGMNVDNTGSYTYVTPSVKNGCDSTTIVYIVVNKVERDTVPAISCDNFTWDVTGVNYDKSGLYSDTILSSLNCDSVIHFLNLTILPQTDSTISTELSYLEYSTYDFEGYRPEAMYLKHKNGVIDQLLSFAPVQLANMKNVYGCDSLLHFVITLLESSDTTFLRDEICETKLPYVWNVGTASYPVYGDSVISLKNKLGGDSVVVLDLEITPLVPLIDTLELCSFSYYWDLSDSVYTESAVDTVVFPSVGYDCDEVHILDLTLNKPSMGVETIAACDSFEWFGINFYDSPVSAEDFDLALSNTESYIYDLYGPIRSRVAPTPILPYKILRGENYLGCDSIVILDLTITKTIYEPSVPVTVCDSFSWLVNEEHPDGVYRTSGTYSVRKGSLSSNCEVVSTIDLTILHSASVDTSVTVCANQPAVFEGLTLSGDTAIKLETYLGCDSIINVKVLRNPVYDTTYVDATCDSVYTWRGKEYRVSGIYVDSLKTASCNCDSVVRLDLTMNQLPIQSIDTAVCGRFIWNGISYTKSGSVSDTFVSVAGCDSIVKVNFVIETPSFADMPSLSLLAGEECKATLPLKNELPSYRYCDADASAEYWYSLDSISWNLVDTTSTVDLLDGDTLYWKVVLSDSYGKLDSAILSQEVYVFDRTAPEFVESCSSWLSVYSVVDTITGNVSFTLSSDSVRAKMSDNCSDASNLRVQWSVNGGEFSSLEGDSTFTLNAYKGDSVIVSWKVADEAGNVSDICDKTYIIERDKDGGDSTLYSIVRDTFVCSNELPFSWHGASFVNDGDTAHVGSTLLRVHVDKSFFVTDTVVACGSYVWRDGLTYTSDNNTAKFSKNNVAACDSVYMLNLTILTPTNIDTVLTICQNQLPYALGSSLVSSDTTLTFNRADGCDSVVNVKLNILPVKRDTISQFACGSYVWNNVELTATGLYSDTLVSAIGCDSIVTLNLTIGQPKFDTVVASNVCGSYVWNAREYTTSGIYTDTLADASGCDSIVTLKLSISPILYDTVRATIHCGTYSWNGAEYGEKGIYNDTLTSSLGCDSIATLVLDVTPAVINVALNTCEGLPGEFKGNSITADTVITMINEATGCLADFVITLHVTPAFSGDTISQFACNSYMWNGRLLTESGVYKDTLSSKISGCDSVAILKLTISDLPIYGDTTFVESCDSYEWMGKIYTSNGIYFDTLASIAGCDSIIAIDLHISHDDTVSVDTTIMVGQSISFYGLNVENATYGLHSFDTMVVSSAGCDVLFHVSVFATGMPIVIDSIEISGGENGNGGLDNIPGHVVGNDTIPSDTTSGGSSTTDGVKVLINGGLWFCQGDVANIKCFATGAPDSFRVAFPDSVAIIAGFKDTASSLDEDGLVRFDIPENLQAGEYNANIQLFGEGMASQIVKVKFLVSMSNSIIKRKWNDVVVCNNSDSLFVSYQWYHNNQKMEGETSQYVSVLEGVEGAYSLDVVTKYGDTLHVCAKDFDMLLPEFSISAYPVPAKANQEFTIQVYGLDKAQLSKAKMVIYSIDGIVVYRDLNGLDEKNVLTLPIGDYVAVVTVENGLSANCKILVKP